MLAHRYGMSSTTPKGLPSIPPGCSMSVLQLLASGSGVVRLVHLADHAEIRYRCEGNVHASVGANILSWSRYRFA